MQTYFSSPVGAPLLYVNIFWTMLRLPIDNNVNKRSRIALGDAHMNPAFFAFFIVAGQTN